MKKSLLDILWEELKIMFYDENEENKHVDELWQKYQIKVIHRFGEEK